MEYPPRAIRVARGAAAPFALGAALAAAPSVPVAEVRAGVPLFAVAQVAAAAVLGPGPAPAPGTLRAQTRHAQTQWYFVACWHLRSSVRKKMSA